jgi:GNAT superfamily N-acetyltransferase
VGTNIADEVMLRPARAVDIPAVLRVTAAAYAPYSGRLQPPSSALKETEEAVAHYLERGGLIVAEADGKLVGAVRYEPHADFVYLGRLAVAPEWQGRGIGRRLVEAVEEWAVLIGLDEVRLGVRLELPDNHALYRHLGYAEDGLMPFAYDPHYSYLKMRKRLHD